MAVVKSTSRKIRSNKAIYNALRYVTNPAKISTASFANGDKFTSASDTVDMYKLIRNSYDKNSGILAHHYVQSFSPDDNLSAEKAHEIGLEFAKKAFPNYEIVVATHTDCDHLHNHFILNAVNSETGFKWADKTETREYLQKISDEICVQNGLSVIGKRKNNSMDLTTYKLGMQGKSWKFELTNVLNEAIKSCNSKEEFIQFMYLKSYSVKYTEKNITITKDGENKGIRVDTLAKSFGEKYTKRNLETAMGYFKSPTIKDFSRYKNKAKPSNYNGEWERYERYIFSQINKPKVVETSKTFGNIALEELEKIHGKNFTGEIDLLELVKLKGLDCFFFAEKKSETASVIIKEYIAD